MAAFSFGPAHPAAHGVLNITISLLFGKLASAEILFGLLARATEKTAEGRTPIRLINYFERLDYVSIMNMELLFSRITEILLTALEFFL